MITSSNNNSNSNTNNSNSNANSNSGPRPHHLLDGHPGDLRPGPPEVLGLSVPELVPPEVPNNTNNAKKNY